MRLIRNVLLLLLLNAVGSVPVRGASQAVYPSGAGVSAGYHVSPTTVAVTASLVIEQWVINLSGGDIAGLYFTFHLPEEMMVIGRWAMVQGVQAPFMAEWAPRPGGGVTWRIVLDSPSGLPDTRVASGDSVHVALVVRVAQAGGYTIPVLGAAFVAGGAAHFAVIGMEQVTIAAWGENCCVIRGDVDGDGRVSVADLTYMVNMLFRSGLSAPCPAEADLHGPDGKITVTDLTTLVNVLFRSDPSPAPC